MPHDVFISYPNLSACAERFSAFVTWARKQYDIVILDAAPSNSFITECAVRASTDIVAPATPDKYALRGIQAISRLMHEGFGLDRPRPIHVLRNAVALEVDPAEQTILDAYPGETLQARVRSSDYLRVRNADPNRRVRDPLSELGFARGRKDLKSALESACDEMLRRYEARNRYEKTAKAA